MRQGMIGLTLQSKQPLKSIATGAQSKMQHWKSIPHPLIQPLFLLFGNKPRSLISIQRV